MYEYRALIESVYDGDTVTARIDVGLSVSVTEKIRLYGIDTPEVRGPDRAAGAEARSALVSRVLGKTVLLRTIKDRKGKYGRWLGILHAIESDGRPAEQSINDWLVAEGFAKVATY